MAEDSDDVSVQCGVMDDVAADYYEAASLGYDGVCGDAADACCEAAMSAVSGDECVQSDAPL